jgi:hypothetical protein
VAGKICNCNTRLILNRLAGKVDFHTDTARVFTKYLGKTDDIAIEVPGLRQKFRRGSDIDVV